MKGYRPGAGAEFRTWLRGKRGAAARAALGCNTMIAAGRGAAGKPIAQVLAEFDEAARRFGDEARARFSRKGEW